MGSNPTLSAILGFAITIEGGEDGMIDVLLVDDHELVRTAIEYLLNDSSGIRVVAVAGSGEEALELYPTVNPHVVLLDVNMPGMGGVEASKRLFKRYPDAKIIALSVHDDGPLPQQLLHLGVQGYVSKSCPAAEMVSAIQMVQQGKRYLSADVASNIALSVLPGELAPFERLSQREMEVVMLTLQGTTIPDMAEILMISAKTVNTYRYRCYEKLGVKNDVELTRLALKYKLINDVVRDA
ncbi:response regulator [Methylogaea oryzae]|uniref:response regulator n=1 Tax=Methylogaea oryzae TaxID=1295382 RepID=UPI00278C760C|nr:response regulator [Methylogaea oryzae]